jgi:methyltransferase (TIGR00027 family)
MVIENVSDTAKWVALYRAMETDRPDALFRDPHARKLAGADGQAIVDSMKRGRGMAWAMITRTKVFDEIIDDAIATVGIDTVVNLAAGLDARPWRMDLPASLRWYDVDLPGILQYKTDLLAGEKTKCHYEAIHADLTDAGVRRSLFARLGADATRALIVTEGLLVYLEPAEVGALASDLSAVRSFHRWAIDLGSPLLLEFMKKSWGAKLANAPFKFGPAEGTAFFTPFGWRELAFRPSMDDARRLKREMKGMWFWRILGKLYSKERQEQFRRMSAIVLLQNARER